MAWTKLAWGYRWLADGRSSSLSPGRHASGNMAKRSATVQIVLNPRAGQVACLDVVTASSRMITPVRRTRCNRTDARCGSNAAANSTRDTQTDQR